MERFKYVMVTKWKGHWDRFYSPIKGVQSTLFTHSVIRDSSLKNGPWDTKVPTLFIKLNEADEFEKSWIGYSENFKEDRFKDNLAVRFEVSGLQELECPREFRTLKSGWYFKEGHVTEPASNDEGSLLDPPFFALMEGCSWQQFEEYCFMLLKLIGIHELHQFSQYDNRGKADGFFKFEGLSVLYDATLEENFENQKSFQIENYIGQLNNDRITIGQHIHTIAGTSRQVWIITRRNKVRTIKLVDAVKVKEVPYLKLIAVFRNRLNGNFRSDDLANQLKDLE